MAARVRIIRKRQSGAGCFGGVLLPLVAVACCPPGCSEEQHPGKIEAATKPAPAEPGLPSPTPASTPDTSEESPRPPAPIELPLSEPSPLREGWLVIKEKADARQRAWVEGSIVGDDKCVLDTSNIRRFRLDLARLRLNWEKRIVLRIDGFNSELTRKRWPVLHFLRTSSGAWIVVDEE